jgi:hypothetical protein
MYEPSYDPTDIEAARSAMVSSPPTEVLAVARQWARDLGWQEVQTGTNDLFFHLGQFVFTSGLEVEVTAYPSEPMTRVGFLMHAAYSVYPSWRADVDRAAETFANGVLFELKTRGATIEPSRLAAIRPGSDWIRAQERFRRPAQWILLGLIIPVTALIWLLTENIFLALAPIFWVFAVVLVLQIGRLRANGMRASLPTAFTVFIFVLAFVSSLVGSLCQAGLIPLVYT